MSELEVSYNPTEFDPEYENVLSGCPFCGSGNFGDEKDESNGDLRLRTFKWNCLDCGNEWYEEFVYVRRYPTSEVE